MTPAKIALEPEKIGWFDKSTSLNDALTEDNHPILRVLERGINAVAMCEGTVEISHFRFYLESGSSYPPRIYFDGANGAPIGSFQYNDPRINQHGNVKLAKNLGYDPAHYTPKNQ